MYPVTKNPAAYLASSKGVSLQVNAGKTKYAFTSRQQNAKQNHNIKDAKKLFQNVAKLQYLGLTLTNQNCIQKKLRSD
jgi:hypothetical protein